MVRRLHYLNLLGSLLLLLLGNSEAFLLHRRPGGGGSLLLSSSSSSSSSPVPNQKASVALRSHRTNVTTLLPHFEEEDQKYALKESPFLLEIEQQLAELQTVQQESASASASALATIPTDYNEKGVSSIVTKDEGMFSELWRARFLLIGAAALYGTNFSLVKVLGDTMPVGVSTTLRFGLATLATLPWLVGDANREGALTAAGLGFEVGLWTSIGYVAQAVGLETTPASESAFICSLAVVTVPLLDRMAGKKLLPRQWTGAILAVLGVAFLELSDVSSNSMTTGDMLSLVQPFAFGMGFWRMETAIQRFPEEAARLTASQLFAVFLSSLAYGLWAFDLPTVQSFPWAEWSTNYSLLFSLFWTGIITTALTIYMETLAMKTLSAAETTLIFSTEPLWGTAFAALVFGEELGTNVAVGAAFILTACIYSNLGKEGIQRLLQGSSANGTDTRTPLRVRDLPAALQRQWIWVTTSLAANLATWSSATQNNSMQTLEELQDTVQEFLNNFMT
jgi:drug/metabolite transporter (DMT)-like permease